MITGISEGKTLVKHISCDFKCEFDGKNVIQTKIGVVLSVSLSIKIDEVLYIQIR